LVGRQEGHPACKKTGCWFVGGDDLTGALHDLIVPAVQLSPLPLSSFASINTGYPRFNWKMAVKTEREIYKLGSST